MKITIIALGSRGDIQPLIPLGQGLQDAGHAVRIATFRAFAPLVLNARLEFFPLQGDAHQLLNSAMDSRLLDGRNNAFRYIQAIRKSYASLGQTLAEDLASSTLHDSELILNQLPAYLYGSDLAEFLDIPWAIVSVIPLARTRYRPMFGFPESLSILPGYNKLSYRLGEQMAWAMFRDSVNQLRTDSFVASRMSLSTELALAEWISAKGETERIESQQAEADEVTTDALWRRNQVTLDTRYKRFSTTLSWQRERRDISPSAWEAERDNFDQLSGEVSLGSDGFFNSKDISYPSSALDIEGFLA